MEKMIELVAKYVPAQLVLAMVALVAAFWGVHYWRGFRDYTDTLRDRYFLSAIVIVTAIAALYLLHRLPAPSSAGRPLLVLPYFANDEREQFRTAFATQLEQEFSRLGVPASSVYRLPVFLDDRDSAVKNAKHVGATAAVFKASVIRAKDQVTACFHVAYVNAEGSKPYAMIPLELPSDTLDAIGRDILGSAKDDAAERAQNPTLVRLDALEGEVASLRAAIDRGTASQRSDNRPYPYKKKHALVVGVNTLQDTGFSLQYAVSDAEAFGATLRDFGFETTVLLDAPQKRFMDELSGFGRTLSDEDLALVYYAGPSTLQGTQAGEGEVVLPFADSDMSGGASGLPITRLAQELKSLRARHTLAVVDGCHGTTGLAEDLPSARLAAAATPSDGVVQILSGSSNNEYALESMELGGGAFTQAMIRVLEYAQQSKRVLWMHELIAETTTFLREHSDARQTPKAVTLSGSGEIALALPQASEATDVQGSDTVQQR